MRCQTCERENEEGSRFCLGCGQMLGTACPHCGKLLPATARFCSVCGKEVAEVYRPEEPAP